MRLGLLLFFTFCLCSHSFSQSNFGHLDTRDGLSQNDINFIYQGSKGFMWFGTFDGLNRYDGIKFKKYQITTKMEDPIGSNLPFCIAEDKEGNFWIGTSDNGIWIYDRKLDKFSQYPENINDKKLLVDKKIGNLNLDSKGYLWAGSDNGVSIIDTKAYYEGQFRSYTFESDQIQFKRSKNNKPINVYNTIEDSDGQIWMCTNLGLYQANLSPTFELSLHNTGTVPLALCRFIHEFEEGYLASLSSGLVYFSKADIALGKKARKVDSRHYTSLVHTSQESFFGANSTGVYELNWDPNQEKMNLVQRFNHEYNNPQSLSRDNVVAMYEDRSGLLWIGTNGGGLNKLDLSKKKFYHVYKNISDKSLCYDKIRGIHEDKQNNLWIGTEGGGMCVLPADKRDRPFDGFVSQDVSHSVAGQNYVYGFLDLKQTEDKVLACMGYPHRLGIASYKDNSITIKSFADKINRPIFCAITDRSGYLWLGSYGGGVFKCVYDPKSNDIKVINQFTAGKNSRGGLSSNIVRSLLEDDSGNIIIGTDLGINFLNASEKNAPFPYFQQAQFEPGDSTSLAHNYVLDLFLDEDKHVWVGTMGGGLCLLKNRSEGKFEFKRYTSEDGLPNDVIKGIEQDNDGFLWLSSNNGLTKFNPKTNEIKNYSVSDGLQDFEFSELASWKNSKGELYFGGVHGYNVFRPSEIKDNPYASQVEFTDLHILNEEILPGAVYNNRVVINHEMPSLNKIKLKYSENSFTIGFSAFHFTAPEKIRYKYKLDGFDTGWVMLKNGIEPEAKYTNMPPGKYELKVLATNNDGVWNTVPASLSIVITAPFWTTWYAILFYIFCFILLLRFFKKYSVIGVTQKNHLMMEHFEQEKMEELVQMKLQFFTNISHEFRTPLTLIQSPLEKLISKGADVNEEYRQKNYILMNKNIGILNRLISQLMDFRKLENGKMPLDVTRGNLNDLLLEVFDAFNEIAANKKIRFEMKNTYSHIELWYDYDKIEKVLYNILSNAFKFTPQAGEVKICIDEIEKGGNEFVRIEVIDNGPGIEKDKLPFLFQRFYQAGSHKLSKVSGTGIGLALAKNLIGLHHGDITVSSIPDEETKFTIFLKKGKIHFSPEDFSKRVTGNIKPKIKVLKDYQDGAARPSTDKDKKQRIKTSKPTILVVEDNHDVQTLLKDNLDQDFNCIQGFNGEEGLELCRSYAPDIIISDVMMPKKDGFEMCTEIKSDNTICHIPIIMLTARSSNADKMSGFEGGAEAYVSKPFNIDLLLAQINSILEARSRVRNKFTQSLEVEPEEVTFTSIDKKLIERLLKIVEQNIGNPEFTVVQLAGEVGMSQSILNKKLKAILGQTANVFIRSIRLKRAGQLLGLQRLSVMDVVYEVGFNDVKYFRECFRKQFNMTPTDYAKQFKQEELEIE